MYPDQTAPIGGSTLFDRETSKHFQQMTQQMFFVVIGP